MPHHSELIIGAWPLTWPQLSHIDQNTIYDVDKLSCYSTVTNWRYGTSDANIILYISSSVWDHISGYLLDRICLSSSPVWDHISGYLLDRICLSSSPVWDNVSGYVLDRICHKTNMPHASDIFGRTNHTCLHVTYLYVCVQISDKCPTVYTCITHFKQSYLCIL